MKLSLSVVVPAYNEEGNIVKCLESLDKYFHKSSYDYEIIVVNDGSRDKTGEIVDKLAKKYKRLTVVHNNPNRGYGGSLKAGFAKATKEFICFIPADNQFDISEVSKLIELQIQNNADIVSGIRVNDQDFSFYRKALRWTWNSLVRALFGYLATDIDCGFKLFRRSILDKFNLSSDGAMIDTQLYANARARNLKIIETPVTHLPRTAGESTGGKLHVAIKALRELLVFWWQLKNELMVERGLAIFRWEAIVIAVVLLVAAFTRLYKIDQYMTFLGDEGRDVMVVRNMIVNFRPILLGPGTSIGNMYLGPLYYYLIAVPLVLSNFSPVGPATAVALFGVATIGLLWWWSRQLVGRVPALLLSTLYSLSPTIIIYSRSSWNPNIMPFFALLAMYGVWKIWRFGYWRWFIITMISFAFVLNSHYLGLLMAPVIGLFVLVAPKSKDYKKYLFCGFGIWALLMSPLVFFDMRHDYMNFKNILQFFTNRQETVNLKVYKAIPNLWTIWSMVVDSLVFAKNTLISFWGSLVFLVSLVLVFKAKPKRDFWFVFVWMLVGLVGLGLYKQHIYDHYFGFLYPAVFLILGFVLSKLNRYLSFGICLFLIGINLWSNPLRFSPNVQWQRTQDMADFILRESGGKPFNLALLSKGNYDMSYRYALILRNAPYRTLHEENTGQLFTICEYDDCKPIGNPLWEIAGFGWAQIDDSWTLPSGLKLYKLGRYAH